MISAILQSMRPKQWTKNLFVFAGLLFTLDKPHTSADILAVVAAFVLFCVFSGSVYLMNDACDIELDKIHPLKRNRPIASGRLSVRAASVAFVFLMVIGLTCAFRLSTVFGIIGAAYLALQIAYSFGLKNIVLLDVMIVATGFVLRAVAGAEVLHVIISQWLLICTILFALFLGLAKRRAEIIRLEENASNHRSSLEQYTVPFLDQLISITTATALMSYALYTFFSDTGKAHPLMMATLPFVIYGIFRYLFLIHDDAGADSPETLLLSDKPLLLDIVLWAVACALIVKLA